VRPSDAGYLPFDGRTFRLRMGTRTLDLDRWLVVDDDRRDDLLKKAELTATHRDEVVAELDSPAAQAASAELESLIVAWLAARGVEVPYLDAERSAIARCGLATQEDWCVLVDLGDGPVLAAASVCFPTRWVLREKIGRSTAAIHAPVAYYDEQLAAPVDALLDRIGLDDARWRLNWNLTDDPSLHQPVRRAGATVDPADVGRRVWLRVERQTLRRLPETGAVAFGIRIHQQPLASLSDDPATLVRLRAAVDAMPEPTFQYKGLQHFAGALRHWIDETVDQHSG
jgi:hypothetical protein